MIDAATLQNPYECPLCRRFFYFEGDYVKHKCSAAKARRKIKMSKMNTLHSEKIKVSNKINKSHLGGI